MDLWSNRNNCCFVHAIATAAIFILLISVIGMPSEANAADFECVCMAVRFDRNDYYCYYWKRWSISYQRSSWNISFDVTPFFFVSAAVLPWWVASCIIKFYRVRRTNLCHAYFSLLWPQTKCPFKQWTREMKKKRRPKRIADGKFFC